MISEHEAELGMILHLGVYNSPFPNILETKPKWSRAQTVVVGVQDPDMVVKHLLCLSELCSIPSVGWAHLSLSLWPLTSWVTNSAGMWTPLCPGVLPPQQRAWGRHGDSNKISYSDCTNLLCGKDRWQISYRQADPSQLRMTWKQKTV